MVLQIFHVILVWCAITSECGRDLLDLSLGPRVSLITRGGDVLRMVPRRNDQGGPVSDAITSKLPLMWHFNKEQVVHPGVRL